MPSWKVKLQLVLVTALVVTLIGIVLIVPTVPISERKYIRSLKPLKHVGREIVYREIVYNDTIIPHYDTIYIYQIKPE